jgi:hypothetical protein
MGDVEYFRPYAHLVDGLIEKTTKDRLADVARRLALNIGYDHEKHGGRAAGAAAQDGQSGDAQ